MSRLAMSRIAARRLLVASALAAVALGASACDPISTHSSAGGATTTSAAAAPAAPAVPAGTVKLVAVDSANLGPIVTDADGRTLYRFDKDTNNPSATNCTGACAVKWPPATVKDTVQLNGVDQSLVGTVTRPDGTRQLTLNGWPLYRFSGDSTAGQTNGQGVGGTWFASTPVGHKAGGGAAAAAPSQSASGDSNGYSSGY
jgi:predicted lipoprotein with Yx(FWY)xxD motif